MGYEVRADRGMVGHFLCFLQVQGTDSRSLTAPLLASSDKSSTDAFESTKAVRSLTQGRETCEVRPAQKNPVPVNSWQASTRPITTVVHLLCAPIFFILHSSHGPYHGSLSDFRAESTRRSMIGINFP